MARINYLKVMALVMQEMAEIEAVKSGEPTDLPPIAVTSGTTKVTVHIHVEQTNKPTGG
jgi:hypothetical protein